VSVTLQLSGGYAGDLYAYLTYDNVLVPLLNRIGVGSGSGNPGTAYGNPAGSINVTLSSTGADVHWATATAGTISGDYAADGRVISPLSSRGSFDAAGLASLAKFNGLNPNGTWTLFIADVSSGGQSTLNSALLSITAVPEPVNVALGFFGGAMLLISLYRSEKIRKLFRPSVSA
jgi:hypothetical protein